MMERLGGEEGPLPSTAASAGRLVGNKKTKAERNSNSAIAGIDVSINMFVDSMRTQTQRSYERSDARWKEIKEAQRGKLALERERV
jgi:hypothetical protein